MHNILFYKGSDFKGKSIKTVPGYVSAEPDEPAQFAAPAVYRFIFNIENLVKIDDFVNGQDNNEKIRSINPGVIGHEGLNEVMINIPVEMELLQGSDAVKFLESIDDTSTKKYFGEILVTNKEMYSLSEEDIIDIITVLTDMDENINFDD